MPIAELPGPIDKLHRAVMGGGICLLWRIRSPARPARPARPDKTKPDQTEPVWTSLAGSLRV